MSSSRDEALSTTHGYYGPVCLDGTGRLMRDGSDSGDGYVMERAGAHGSVVLCLSGCRPDPC